LHHLSLVYTAELTFVMYNVILHCCYLQIPTELQLMLDKNASLSLSY